jgi:hypothetical protein
LSVSREKLPELLRLFLLFLFTATLSSAQSIPAVKAKALDDTEVTLPDPGKKQTVILIVGFSKKSGEPSRVWGKKISAGWQHGCPYCLLVVPVLQGAPPWSAP